MKRPCIGLVAAVSCSTNEIAYSRELIQIVLRIYPTYDRPIQGEHSVKKVP
jgi:hypothetical protein